MTHARVDVGRLVAPRRIRWPATRVLRVDLPLSRPLSPGPHRPAPHALVRESPNTLVPRARTAARGAAGRARARAAGTRSLQSSLAGARPPASGAADRNRRRDAAERGISALANASRR